MDPIKYVWVGQERALSGLGAEIDRPAAIFGARIVGRVRIAKDPSSEGDEAVAFFAWGRLLTCPAQAGDKPTLRLLNFRNQDFKGTDCQSAWRLCNLQAFGAGK